MIKYKDVDMTSKSDVMTTSGPLFADAVSDREAIALGKKKDKIRSPEKEAEPEPASESQPVQKTIIIQEKDGSISFSIDGEWGSHETIGALEVVKATILARLNQPMPGIMDRILMNAGIN